MSETIHDYAAGDGYRYRVTDPQLRPGEVVVEVTSLDGRTRAREWIPADSATPQRCAEVAEGLWHRGGSRSG